MVAKHKAMECTEQIPLQVNKVIGAEIPPSRVIMNGSGFFGVLFFAERKEKVMELWKRQNKSQESELRQI